MDRRMDQGMARRTAHRTDRRMAHRTDQGRSSRTVERSCCVWIGDENRGSNGISHDASNAGFPASRSKACTRRCENARMTPKMSRAARVKIARERPRAFPVLSVILRDAPCCFARCTGPNKNSCGALRRRFSSADCMYASPSPQPWAPRWHWRGTRHRVCRGVCRGVHRRVRHEVRRRVRRLVHRPVPRAMRPATRHVIFGACST